MFKRSDGRETNVPVGTREIADGGSRFRQFGPGELAKVAENEFLPEPLMTDSSNLVFIRKAKDTLWLDESLENRAKEHFEGLFHSKLNDLPLQASLHLSGLRQVYSENSCAVTLQVSLTQGWDDAKLFAVKSDPGEEFDIEGHGFAWRLVSIRESNELVPAKFLRRLTVLQLGGIKADTMFVAVPYNLKEASLSQAVKEDIQKIGTAVRTMAQAGKKALEKGFAELQYVIIHADPVFIVGFGESPMFLVELGRWI